MDLLKYRQLLNNGQIVGLTIYGEARNQSFDGKIAVGNVIRNRLFSRENFGGNTYKDICLAKHQFSCWFEENENRDELENAIQLVIGGNIYKNLILKECLYLGQGITDNQFHDNVNGALYYRTIKLMKEKPVDILWKIELGYHVFYKLV